MLSSLKFYIALPSPTGLFNYLLNHLKTGLPAEAFQPSLFAMANAVVKVPLFYQNLFFAKARPAPDLRYFSNFNASD